MAILIDASVLIDAERAGRPLIDLLAQEYGVAPDEDWALPTMAISEFLRGVYGETNPSRRDRRQAWLERTMSGVPLLGFDLPAAHVHARVCNELDARGTPVGAHDVIIAATAIAHDREVVTANARDFARIPGLRLRVGAQAAPPRRRRRPR